MPTATQYQDLIIASLSAADITGAVTSDLQIKVPMFWNLYALKARWPDIRYWYVYRETTKLLMGRLRSQIDTTRRSSLGSGNSNSTASGSGTQQARTYRQADSVGTSNTKRNAESSELGRSDRNSSSSRQITRSSTHALTQKTNAFGDRSDYTRAHKFIDSTSITATADLNPGNGFLLLGFNAEDKNPPPSSPGSFVNSMFGFTKAHTIGAGDNRSEDFSQRQRFEKTTGQVSTVAVTIATNATDSRLKTLRDPGGTQATADNIAYISNMNGGRDPDSQTATQYGQDTDNMNYKRAYTRDKVDTTQHGVLFTDITSVNGSAFLFDNLGKIQPWRPGTDGSVVETFGERGNSMNFKSIGGSIGTGSGSLISVSSSNSLATASDNAAGHSASTHVARTDRKVSVIGSSEAHDVSAGVENDQRVSETHFLALRLQQQFAQAMMLWEQACVRIKELEQQATVAERYTITHSNVITVDDYPDSTAAALANSPALRNLIPCIQPL